MNAEIDEIIPRGKWQFDASVTTAFQDMLKRSIPGYAQMRDCCFQIGRHYVQNKTDIIDLGCSRGDALEPFIAKFGAYNHYVAVDVSGPMLDACRQRFANYIDRGVVEVKSLDLRRGYPPVRASLTLAILTIQFTPIEYRHQILDSIFAHTVRGGALIVVEKIIGCNASIDKALTDCYYDVKRQAGYSDEQIQRKKLSLEGVLVPLTAAENEYRLSVAGFKTIECFWRNLNFSGWIAVRE